MMISTAKLTPDNINQIKPVAYLGRGKIKAMAWVDHDTLAVVTLFALWHYTRDGDEREVLRFQEMGERSNIVLSGQYTLLWNGRTTLRIYDIQNGALLASVECGYISNERFVCICTADASRVAFVSGDQVKVFDTQTGSLIASAALAYILDIVFSEDERQILILCGNGVVYHFDLNTKEIVSRNFLKDETWMLEQWLLTQKLHPFYYHTVHYDARDILHPVKSGKDIQLWYNGLIHTFRGHEHPVWRVFFASKDTLVSYDRHENVFLWDADTGQEIAHTGALGTDFIAVNPDLSAVAAVNSEYEVVIWNRETDEKHRFPHGHRKPARPFYLDHEVLLSTEDGWIYEWELASGKIVKKYEAAGKFFIMSSDRQYVACVDQNDALRLHCLKSDQTRLTRDACTPLLFTSDSLLYLVEAFQWQMSSHHGYNLNNTSSTHLTIMRVNLETGEEEIFLTIAPGHQAFFAPNGDYYAISVPSEGVSIFEVASHRFCHFIMENVDQGYLIFSPDAKYVLINVANRQWGWHIGYTLWDVETGQPLETFNHVHGVAFNGDTIAVKTHPDIIVWNKHLRTTFPYQDVSWLTFSGSFLIGYGTYYVTIQTDQVRGYPYHQGESRAKIQMWDGTRHLLTLSDLSYPNFYSTFRIHEKLLAVGNTDCTITLWGVENSSEV